MKLLAGAVVPLAMFASVLGLVVLIGGAPAAEPDTGCVADAEGTPALSLDQEQLNNAATIIEVGRARNVPPYGWVIALAASLQESSLRNLAYGDRDSAGLFQMRPSMGWGSFGQVTDPVYAAAAFFGGPDVPPANPGLLDVEGWEQLSVEEAAQAVERSAFPDAYAKWEADAAAIVAELSGQDLSCPAGLAKDCPPSGRSVEAGLAPGGVMVVRCAVAHFGFESIGGLATSGHVSGSDHYTGRAVDLMVENWAMPAGSQLGDEAAAYFVRNADIFDITYIIWRAQIWSVERPHWRPYTHPSGATNPTLLHLDHLHISVAGSASTIATAEETIP